MRPDGWIPSVWLSLLREISGASRAHYPRPVNASPPHSHHVRSTTHRWQGPIRYSPCRQRESRGAVPARTPVRRIASRGDARPADWRAPTSRVRRTPTAWFGIVTLELGRAVSGDRDAPRSREDLGDALIVSDRSIPSGDLVGESSPSSGLLTCVDSVVSLLFRVGYEVAGIQTLVTPDSHVSGRMTSTTALIDVAIEQMRAVALALECPPHEAQPRFGRTKAKPGTGTRRAPTPTDR